MEQSLMTFGDGREAVLDGLGSDEETESTTRAFLGEALEREEQESGEWNVSKDVLPFFGGRGLEDQAQVVENVPV
jgi:hypothetical protein